MPCIGGEHSVKRFDELTMAKLLSCRMVVQAWLLSFGLGALGLLTMVALG